MLIIVQSWQPMDYIDRDETQSHAPHSICIP